MNAVTTTVFSQMLYREKHGLSKEAIKDQCHLGAVQGFDPSALRGADMLKTRRLQCLPLLPLYITKVPVLQKYLKKARKSGISVSVPDFELPWLDPIDVTLQEMRAPGHLDKMIRIGHAVVGPVASSLRDGKVYREHPNFTFDGILVNSHYYQLGADVLMRTGTSDILCKLVSSFMHSSESLEPDQAVYVCRYLPLSEYVSTTKDDPKFVQQIKRQSVGARELILCEDEILVRGASLNFFAHEVKVCLTEAEFQASTSSHVYLCRLAVDHQVCFPLSHFLSRTACAGW